MTDIEKSPKSPESRGQQTVNPFDRLRASMKKMAPNGVVKGGRLYLVVDGSSSMCDYCTAGVSGSGPKYEAVKKVITDIQTKYAGHIPLDLIEFTKGARQLQGLDSYPLGGGTDILPALQLLTIPGSQVVLLSDGDSTNHTGIVAELPRLKAANIVVNCIGVGVSSSGRALLERIAFETGGAYVGIEADLQLIFDTFKALASKAVAALTAGQGAIAVGGAK